MNKSQKLRGSGAGAGKTGLAGNARATTRSYSFSLSRSAIARIWHDSSTLIFAALLTGCASLDTVSPDADVPDPAAGVLTVSDGTTTTVVAAELRFSGEATLEYPRGTLRTGTWVDGALHGLGTEATPTDHYTGQWHEGARQGHGELEQLDGARYVGEFHAGLRQGIGTQTSTGGVYRGAWAAGQRDGQGQFNATDGTIYQGQWVAGRRQGYGQATFASGGFYDGQWVQDNPHGFGRFVFPANAMYQGEWVEGARQGYGTWHSPAGLSYEGTWHADERHGYGKETRPDGSHYAGDWNDGKKHGQGREVSPDGSSHAGTWHNDEILGAGNRTDRTGIIIAGSWQNGRVTQGSVTLPSQQRFEGEMFSTDGARATAALTAWLLELAQASDPHAQYLLATVQLDFTEDSPEQPAAQVWMRKAATAGIAQAQYRLALLLLEEDVGASLEWLARAADQHHPNANEMLGEYFHTGLYLPQDYRAAIGHYERASANGSIAAANNLAWLLATTAREEIADPQRALELIRPFVLYLGGWQYLDTLAAAHARLGEREIAQRLQSRAVIEARSLASERTLDEMSARLELYRKDQAYVE